MMGELNYEVVRRYVDDVVLIDDATIASGVRDLTFSAKLLAEPAGAAAVAAILSGAIPVKRGERVAAVVSGGNVDAAKLAAMLSRHPDGSEASGGPAWFDAPRSSGRLQHV